MSTGKGMKDMLYLTLLSTHFIYGYMVNDYFLSERNSHCNHYMGYSFRLAARYLLYAPSHRQDSIIIPQPLLHQSWNTYGTRNNSVGPPRGIDPKTHSNMNGSSTTQLHFAPCSGKIMAYS